MSLGGFCLHLIAIVTTKVSERLHFKSLSENKEKVTNTCLPVYKGHSAQGISCSFQWHLVPDSALSGPWVVLCFCWPAVLWFLPERALETGRVSAFGLFALYFSKVFLLSALYHFMFASCMNSCGGGKGKWSTQTLSGKVGPFVLHRRELKWV